jgi:hypothetical protein
VHRNIESLIIMIAILLAFAECQRKIIASNGWTLLI